MPWIARTGSPLRDLSREFGKWNSVFQRCRRWSKAGRFARIFAEISGEPNMEYAMIDGAASSKSTATARVQRGGLNQTIMTTQILALVDALRNLADCACYPGNVITFAGLNLFRTCS